MKATEFFMSRPRLAAVAALVAVLAGVLSAPLVPVAMYPTLARPSISVSCSYPGANAVEVMNTVAGPLEEKINGVEGMDRMTSSCHDTGSYSLTVNFAVGYDRDVALMKVQSKVQQALSLLPQEVKTAGKIMAASTPHQYMGKISQVLTERMTQERAGSASIIRRSRSRIPRFSRGTRL